MNFDDEIIWRFVQASRINTFAMNKLLVTLGILLCQTVMGVDLQHFNPDIFGKPVGEGVKLLLVSSTNSIEPICVQVDVKTGRYCGATVSYPKTLSFEEARTSLNSLYGKFEKSNLKNPKFGMWRNEEKKFAIQLIEEEEEIKVLYVPFQPLDAEFLKKVQKAVKIIEKEKAGKGSNGKTK